MSHYYSAPMATCTGLRCGRPVCHEARKARATRAWAERVHWRLLRRAVERERLDAAQIHGQYGWRTP